MTGWVSRNIVLLSSLRVLLAVRTHSWVRISTHESPKKTENEKEHHQDLSHFFINIDSKYWWRTSGKCLLISIQTASKSFETLTKLLRFFLQTVKFELLRRGPWQSNDLFYFFCTKIGRLFCVGWLIRLWSRSISTFYYLFRRLLTNPSVGINSTYFYAESWLISEQHHA